MPSALTYPGVYVEEIPSGVRTITGVSTSIAAFAGLAPRGLVNKATTITSWADYERTFGGLVYEYPMSYAVRDFYENGGVTAIIVRTFDATAKLGSIKINDFEVQTSSPGKWGNNLRVRVDVTGITQAIADDLKVDKAHLYNLTIHDTATGVTESFPLVTSEDTPRRVDRMLASSSFVTLKSAADKIPGPHTKTVPPASEAEWKDDAFSSGINNGPLVDSGVVWKDGLGDASTNTGIYALDRVDLFNILCLPPETRGGDFAGKLSDALSYCVRKRAMLIVDPPVKWKKPADVTETDPAKGGLIALGIASDAARNAAIYFPRVRAADRARGGMIDTFVPCGYVAGIMARTDVTRGVWKAPAGVDAALLGALGLDVVLTDQENGLLNPIGVNCLRTFPIVGTVVWGARTMRGADLLGDEYKYVPIRRLALFLEESLFRGLQWVVFEPNDEPLWAAIRLNVGAFMHDLFRQGAFQGSSPRDAYFVLCDKTTNPQSDINKGIVNVIVGFAPLKPAEFVVLKIQQMAGQIQT